jgi:hypothetical protein
VEPPLLEPTKFETEKDLRPGCGTTYSREKHGEVKFFLKIYGIQTGS